jgi:hypothetical protein
VRGSFKFKFKFKYLFLIGTQALIFAHDLIILMVHMKSDIMSMFSYVGLLDGWRWVFFGVIVPMGMGDQNRRKPSVFIWGPSGLQFLARNK